MQTHTGIRRNLFMKGDGLKIELADAGAGETLFARCGNLHQEVIFGGFLTKLGPRFLSRFYRAVATMPDSFLITARDGEDVIGLIAGSTNSKKVVRQFFVREAIFFIPHIAGVLLRPSYLRRIIETLIYPSKQEFSDLPDAEILNFAIAPQTQGKGVGQKMFNALCEEFRKRDIADIRIVTGGAQESAQRFYERAGAQRVTSVAVHGKDQSVVFTYHIPPA